MNTSTSVTIVSPHHDDAGLSLGLSMRRWARRGVAVNVLNCFTFTRWAPFSGVDSVADVMEIRHSEDMAFGKRCGISVRFVDLGALDSPIRLGASDTCAIFASKPFSTEDRATLDDLEVRLAATLPEGVVLGPLAARDHIDHRIAREACCNIASTRPVGFFEDLPYSAEISAESLYGYVAQVQEITGCPLVPHLVGGTSSDEDKDSLVAAYASQLEPSDYAAVARTKRSGERLWLPERHLSCFRFLVMMDGP